MPKGKGQLLTDIEMLLMIKKELGVDYVILLIDMQKLIINIWKITVKTEKYWDVNNLYGWEMSQKLPVNGFKWVKDLSECNEVYIKSYTWSKYLISWKCTRTSYRFNVFP